MPFVNPADTAKHRALRLACLTTPYAELWNEHARTLIPLPWHSDEPRLFLSGPIESKGPPLGIAPPLSALNSRGVWH